LERTHPIYSIGPKTHVLERFRLFRYCTKVDAKLAELVPLTHKFAKEGRVRIFHNERTQSVIGHKTQVFRRFGPRHYRTKADAKLAELVPLTDKFAKQCRVGIFRIERTRSTPIDPKLMF
jgi:hypothetical protein